MSAFDRSGEDLESLTDFPDRFDYIWRWYLDLNAARPASGMAICPIPWSEVESYSRLIDIKIKPWEAIVLRNMDLAVVSHLRAKEASKTKDGKSKNAIPASKIRVADVIRQFAPPNKG